MSKKKKRRLVDKFRDAVLAEDLTAVDEAFTGLTEAVSEAERSGTSAGPAWSAYLAEMNALVDHHGDQIRRWCARDPELRRVVRRVAGLMERMARQGGAGRPG
jgi:hypothetical protein